MGRGRRGGLWGKGRGQGGGAPKRPATSASQVRSASAARAVWASSVPMPPFWSLKVPAVLPGSSSPKSEVKLFQNNARGGCLQGRRCCSALEAEEEHVGGAARGGSFGRRHHGVVEREPPPAGFPRQGCVVPPRHRARVLGDPKELVPGREAG